MAGFDGAGSKEQQVTSLCGTAGAAQHGRDRPAGLGEGQRVVARLGGLQRPVGGRPCERVVVELDHEASCSDVGVGEQRAGGGALVAVRVVARGGGGGDQRREPGGHAVVASILEVGADRGDPSAERGERDGFGVGGAVIQHVFKASARIGQLPAAAD